MVFSLGFWIHSWKISTQQLMEFPHCLFELWNEGHYGRKGHMKAMELTTINSLIGEIQSLVSSSIP